MITAPLNDTECLGKLHAFAETWMQAPALEPLAQALTTTEELAAYLRALPQRTDAGDPRDGPRIECPGVSQRLRTFPADPNCFERTAIYLGLAERIEPNTPRSSLTLRVNGRMHTIPIEYRNAVATPVVLDPAPPPRNVLAAAIHHAELGHGRQPRLTEPSIVLPWLFEVAHNAAPSERERDLVNAGRRSIEQNARNGATLDLPALAYTLALAEPEAALFDEGRAAWEMARDTLRNWSVRLDPRVWNAVGQAATPALRTAILAKTGPAGLAAYDKLQASAAPSSSGGVAGAGSLASLLRSEAAGIGAAAVKKAIPWTPIAVGGGLALGLLVIAATRK